jgi:membrane protease YdiL (CAAX protease family)
MSSTLIASAPFVSDRARPDAPFIPLKAVSLRTVIWTILLGIGMITPVVVLSGLLPLPALNSDLAVVQQRWLGYVLNPWALALKALLFMPLLEEVFYRGLVLQLLRRYVPAWIAVLVTSSFFGLTHISNGWENVFSAFVLGCVFATLVVHTRSLFASIVCHFFVNFTWLFLVAPGFGLVERLINLDPAKPVLHASPLSLFPAWWLAASLVLVTAATWMLRKDNRRSTAG